LANTINSNYVFFGLKERTKINETDLKNWKRRRILINSIPKTESILDLMDKICRILKVEKNLLKIDRYLA
jgi:hypothetical protein